MASTVICILGMHRSGTSCLTGTLEEAGVFLGEIVRRSRYNAKGNREHPRITALHNHILRANGGSWDEPPERVHWSPDHELKRDKIIEDFQGKSPWGFKDPRTLYTLDGWLAALSQLTLVGVLRHPLAVAQSLHDRNQLSLEKGIHLWTLYNQRLLAYFHQFQFPILSFDLEDQALRARLLALLKTLGLPLPAERLAFFDPSLRHAQATAQTPLPAAASSLYEQLNKIAH